LLTYEHQTVERCSNMTRRIGADAGGTFAGVCLFDQMTGRVTKWKVASTQSPKLCSTQAPPA
jgi:N-methylhydantoinase A/oxoprolinase/acetone carboxylase beta subunit